MTEPAHVGGADPAALIEAYYERGWTDGLPVVPPSQSAVAAMLRAGGVAADAVVGVVTERNVRLTADKVAVNAVMAGCLPEYMPVVLGAVRALCDPAFNLHGPATSTGGPALLTLVNGPIAVRLGINARDNVLGPGVRANATIGRALRLMLMNAVNSRPGKLDRSTLGQPGKYTYCIAEDEAQSPWAPLHVERGYDAGQSTVTVMAADSRIQVYNQLSSEPEQLLLCFADALAGLGPMTITGQADALVLVAGEHMAVIRRAGWSKAQLREYIHAHARRTVAELKRAGRVPGPVAAEDETTWRHPVPGPEHILVVPAGGAVGNFSAVITGWSKSRTVTAPIAEP